MNIVSTRASLPFQGTLVKLNEEQQEQLVETLQGDKTKLARVDTFTKTLDKKVSDRRNAPETVRVTMEYDDSNKIQGLRCKLKFAVDNFYPQKRNPFPELVVNVAKPSIDKIKSWLKTNYERVDGRENLITDINKAIREAKYVDFSYQGILPYPTRQDFTEFDKASLKEFAQIVRELDSAYSTLAELDPHLQHHKIMFNQTHCGHNEFMNGRYAKPNAPKTSYAFDVDAGFIKRSILPNALKELLPDVPRAKFDNNSEGLKKMCDWVTVNLIVPCNLAIEELREDDPQPEKLAAVAYN